MNKTRFHPTEKYNFTFLFKTEHVS